MGDSRSVDAPRHGDRGAVAAGRYERPAVFVEPPYLAVDAVPNEKAERIAPPSGDVFRHPSGARRITAVRLVLPKGFRAGPEVGLLESNGIAALGRGEECLLELTLDDGARKKTADLRPTLPLLLRY
jgi:hypothetical protein